MPTYIASNSFGKDSIATILLALEHNEPLDRSFTVEVMFDNSRGISGEIPEHIQWVYDVAKPKLERMGVVVDIVRSREDYITLFNHILTRGKYIGKVQGAPLLGKCYVLSSCKRKTIHEYNKQFPDAIHYIGIAADEKKRLTRLKENQISLMNKYRVTERMAMDMCRAEGLLSPLYQTSSRGGCWFCPNQRPKQFINLYNNHRELFTELKELSLVPNQIKPTLKFDKTFRDIEKMCEADSLQLKLF